MGGRKGGKREGRSEGGRDRGRMDGWMIREEGRKEKRKERGTKSSILGVCSCRIIDSQLASPSPPPPLIGLTLV